jgi:3'-phosphoadenosine 5'-phosphosulfate sulfotransferase (PAPS reductase)/FAD synthetase
MHCRDVMCTVAFVINNPCIAFSTVNITSLCDTVWNVVSLHLSAIRIDFFCFLDFVASEVWRKFQISLHFLVNYIREKNLPNFFVATMWKFAQRKKTLDRFPLHFTVHLCVMSATSNIWERKSEMATYQGFSSRVILQKT